MDAMKKELQLNRPLDISIVPNAGAPTAVPVPESISETTLKPAMTMFRNPNATNYDKLMHNLGIPIPNPNAATIQHKTELGLSAFVPPKGPVKIPSVFLVTTTPVPTATAALVVAASSAPKSLVI